MPKKGWSSVTIPEEQNKKIQEFIDQENKKAGFKKYRSASHVVEEALAKFFKEKETET